MTAQSRTVLVGRYENGDVPQGSDYVDLIDSFVSLTDTTAQSVASQLTVPTLVATEVSATNVNATNLVSTSATFTTLGVSLVSAASLIAASAVMTTLNVSRVSGAAVFTASANVSALIVGDTIRLNTATTAKASGGVGGAVPASAEGFAEINIGGTVRYVAYFNVKA